MILLHHHGEYLLYCIEPKYDLLDVLNGKFRTVFAWKTHSSCVGSGWMKFRL